MAEMYNGNFDNNNENNENENNNVTHETFEEYVRRQWNKRGVKTLVISGAAFIAGAIIYGKGKKAGMMKNQKLLERQLDQYAKTSDISKMPVNGILRKAFGYGNAYGMKEANRNLIDLLSATTGEGKDALNKAIQKAVETTLGQDFIVESCMEYLECTIDKNLTEEIKEAAAKKAYEELKNNDALKDVVYEASAKASKRILENGTLVEGIIKRTAGSAAMEYFESKRFRKELKDEVSDQFKELIDDDVTEKVLKPVVEKIMEDIVD